MTRLTAGGAALLVLLFARPAAADISVPFREMLERRNAPGIVHEPAWDTVRAEPGLYRERTISYLLRVAGRIDDGSKTTLLAYNQDGVLIDVLCPGGCRAAEPGQWIALLGHIDPEGPVQRLIGDAAARIAAPKPKTPSAEELAAAATALTAARGGANGAAPLRAEEAEAPPTDTPPAEPGALPPQPPPEPIEPLDAARLAQRQATPPAPQGYDAGALWRLERFITSRNPRIDPSERRLIATEVLRLSALYGMRWEFFAAMLAAESDYNKNCVSRAGAMGLGQLMPFNCVEYGVTDPFDIRQNLRGSAEHIAEFLRKYSDRDPTEQFKLALACYNAGPGAVRRYGGVPPYAETVNYISKIARLYIRLCEESAAAGR